MPSSLKGIHRLEYLSLENNSISGTILSSISYLSSLRYLYLNSNRISGDIPFLGYLYSIYELDLKHNLLNGSIPSSIGDRSVGVSVLRYLSLDNNQLSGSIPSSLGDHSLVSYLGLGNNHLSGEIPSGFGDLSTLVYLSLENNLLSGQIPQTFAKLAMLKELYLADNDLLTGLFPSLPDLIVLDISGTDLYLVKAGSTTISESISTETTNTSLISDERETAQPINLTVIVVSSVGGFALAYAMGITILILIAKRRVKNERERERDNHAKINEARSNLYQLSRRYCEAGGNTGQSGNTVSSLLDTSTSTAIGLVVISRIPSDIFILLSTLTSNTIYSADQSRLLLVIALVATLFSIT
jgi:hypothetical protein